MQEASQQLYYKQKFEDIDKAIESLQKALQKITLPTGESNQSKDLVDWSCPLLKGCNTNYGELLDKNKFSLWIASSQWNRHTGEDLRLLPPATPTSGRQVYHQVETNLQTLHDAGFVVEIGYSFIDVTRQVIYHTNTTYEDALCMTPKYAQHYRVIGIREGFTDVPESAT